MVIVPVKRVYDHCEAHVVTNQIVLYKPPKVENKPSYSGRETVRTDCSLNIHNVSLMDITYYILQRNTSVSSETGQIFLVVLGKSAAGSQPINRLANVPKSCVG
uniref:Uncharacterized protein n=1 Tax=Salvator merianae TaxID=96440 RepID=A0A8D0BI43_SALMN